MKKLLTLLLCVSALGLTACDSRQESETEHNIRMGKLCADSGGSWTWSDWSGYHCDIKAKP
jgi:hypothetical protein